MTARRSLILDATVRLVFDVAVVLSVYLLFAGHNQPGGGFVGGLILAAAVALRYLAEGIDKVRSLFPFRPWTFLSAGLAIAAGSALVPVIFGRPALDQGAFEVPTGIFGEVKVPSALAFDTGVYLIVIGFVLMVFEGLGDEDADEVEVEVEPS